MTSSALMVERAARLVTADHGVGISRAPLHGRLTSSDAA